MARTLIHESLHAYLKFIGKPGTDVATELNNIAKEKGYLGKDGDLNFAHHEFMVGYVTAMAASLKRWDTANGSGGTLGDDYYTAMAFGGLVIDPNPNDNIKENVFNDAAKAFINNPEKENEILQILINEQDGNTNAKGEKCN